MTATEKREGCSRTAGLAISEIRSISLIHWSGLSTAATRRAAFPLDEQIETAPAPAAPRADVCLTAPETSCRQTATALGLTAHVEDALRDCDYGTWRGHTLDDIAAANPDAVTRWLTDPSAAPHGGESTLDLLARVAA